jgi:phosphohistidine phosphatase
MKVFLLRHMEASYGVADPERPLTESGTRMAAGLARQIAGRSWYRYAEVWCSPYLRARQSAAPLLKAGGKQLELQLMDDLVPDGDPDPLVERLKRASESVLVVGHNPHLTRVARRLLGLGRADSTLDFKKGMLFVFRRESASPTGFTLAACLSPGSIGLRR